MTDKMAEFKTGATRSAETLFDPAGFLSPAVLVGFCRYMERHRTQADGNVRASDNWQKGMPTSRAYRSLTRHFLDAWLMARGYPAVSADCKTPEDALHAILFNVSVILKNRIDGDDHEEDGRPSSSAERWAPREDCPSVSPSTGRDCDRGAGHSGLHGHTDSQTHQWDGGPSVPEVVAPRCANCGRPRGHFGECPTKD